MEYKNQPHKKTIVVTYDICAIFYYFPSGNLEDSKLIITFIFTPFVGHQLPKGHKTAEIVDPYVVLRVRGVYMDDYEKGYNVEYKTKPVLRVHINISSVKFAYCKSALV